MCGQLAKHRDITHSPFQGAGPPASLSFCLVNYAQSSGGVAIPQTLPGRSSASPSSQIVSKLLSDMQFTTCAVTGFLATRPSNCTALPISTERPTRTAQPCGFTRTIWHGSENGRPESTLVRVAGIWHGTRVPQRLLVSLGIEFMRFTKNFCQEVTKDLQFLFTVPETEHRREQASATPEARCPGISSSDG